MPGMPSGTVSFLFTDIEGSTRLWENNPAVMAPALARHDALVRAAIVEYGGLVFKTVGDAFCAAFPVAQDALRAACRAQLSLAAEAWPDGVEIRVRMAIHTGSVQVRDNDYFGQPLNRVARLLATAHGGQVVLSLATQELVRDGLPADVSLIDLGVVRLKDLIRPEQVFQVVAPGLPSDFPLLRSLDQRRHNLPTQSTSFVGREAETRQLVQMISSSRLVTLVGSGGTGKTRLALQAGAELIDELSGGVWLVELAVLREPSLVVPAVAAALGIKDRDGKPVAETLAERVGEMGAALLILDNCEHVLDACVSVCHTLMALGENLKVLATSREALRTTGERIFAVPPLSTPDPLADAIPATLAQYAAVQLFIDRAKAARPSFDVDSGNAPALASICHRLDGIPLAIELAAARVRSLSLSEINDRLDRRFRLLTGGSRDALPRQQTLRSLIDWSYDLLSGEEKCLLERLSVFAGGCTLAAGEAVCGGGMVDESSVVDLLAGLTDKSLVAADEHQGTTRYRMLETIRQYAAERLETGGSAIALRSKHFDYFFNLAHRMHASEDYTKWVGTFDHELDNIRAALACSLSGEVDAVRGLAMGHKVSALWALQGQWIEARRVLRALLARCSSVTALDPLLKCKAIASIAYFEWVLGEFVASRAMNEESLAIARSLGDLASEVQVVRNLGIVRSAQGEVADGLRLSEEAVALARQLGNLKILAVTLSTYASMLVDAGNFDHAREIYAESLELAKGRGDQIDMANALSNLGHLSAKTGDFQRAETHCRDGLSLLRRLGVRLGISSSMIGLGMAAAGVGDALRAARLLGAAERLNQPMGVGYRSAKDWDEYRQMIQRARQSLADDSAFDAAWAEGSSWSDDEAMDYALSGQFHNRVGST